MRFHIWRNVGLGKEKYGFDYRTEKEITKKYSLSVCGFVVRFNFNLLYRFLHYLEYKC